MEHRASDHSDQMDGTDRLVWKENERGLHLSLAVLNDTFSATGITTQSVLEVMVLELADSLAHQMEHSQASPPPNP